MTSNSYPTVRAVSSSGSTLCIETCPQKYLRSFEQIDASKYTAEWRDQVIRKCLYQPAEYHLAEFSCYQCLCPLVASLPPSRWQDDYEPKAFFPLRLYRRWIVDTGDKAAFVPAYFCSDQCLDKYETRLRQTYRTVTELSLNPKPVTRPPTIQIDELKNEPNLADDHPQDQTQIVSEWKVVTRKPRKHKNENPEEMPTME